MKKKKTFITLLFAFSLLISLAFTNVYSSAKTPEETTIEETTIEETTYNASRENEANDTKSSATKLAVGDSCKGEIGSYKKYVNDGEDVDWYSIELEAGKIYKISVDDYIKVFQDTSLMIKLFDPKASSKLLSYELKNQGVNYYEYSAKISGTYYIKFYNFFDINNTVAEYPYTISVNDVTANPQRCNHEFVAKVDITVKNQLASSANCVFPAKYYKYCVKCKKLANATFEYGATDKNNHMGDIEIRGGWTATCTKDGYSGDKYCKACGAKVSSGYIIDATGHQYDGGVVTKEPTLTEEGVNTFTCTVCKATRTEKLPKLSQEEPEPAPTPNPNPNPTPTPLPSEAGTIINAGIYVAEADREHILAGLFTEGVDKNNIEYSWYALEDSDNQNLSKISDWTRGNEWISWTPEKFGKYIIIAKARVVGYPDTEVSASYTYEYHPHIMGLCQMPYKGEKGEGYLIGVESYENPNQSYYYEMLILDCTLLAEGKDAWIYTTDKFKVSEGKAGWVIWTPQYGYYWTLFRVYDENGKLIDQRCYPFANAY